MPRAMHHLLCILFTAAALGACAEDQCKGRAPGTIAFFTEQPARGRPLPQAKSRLTVGQPMYALACLTERVGPQPEGGTKFRVVLHVKALKTEGRSSFQVGKQLGVLRPALPRARKDVVFTLHQDFDHLDTRLDKGEYEFDLQAATDKGTGKLELTLDPGNTVAYVQALTEAGYVADGKVTVVFE